MGFLSGFSKVGFVENYGLNIDCEPSTYIGDGICDDHSNHHMCLFDGGDCCLPDADNLVCIICECHQSRVESI